MYTADNRVAFVEEPAAMECVFRGGTSAHHSMPKFWADAYLVAFAEQAGGTIITFDKGLAARARGSILLQ
jgi:predicted nucleic acid-binding protein